MFGNVFPANNHASTVSGSRGGSGGYSAASTAMPLPPPSMMPPPPLWNPPSAGMVGMGSVPGTAAGSRPVTGYEAYEGGAAAGGADVMHIEQSPYPTTPPNGARPTL